jgi:hypothetical protein
VAFFGGRSDDDRDDDERGPWGSRGFVASVIVMIAVVICGLSLLFLGGSDDPESAPSPSPTGPDQSQPTEPGPTDGPTSSAEPTENPTPGDPTPVDPTPPSRPGPCKIPAGDQRILSTAPASVVWRFEAGLLVPTKSTIGPGARDANGVVTCFARSPIGAVFAAMNTLAQVRDESISAQVLEKRMAPGPGRTRALNQARTNQRYPTPGRAAADVQFVGFKIIDYTPTRTVLSLAVQTDIEHIGGMAVTMRWVDGDWRVHLRSDGSISGDPDVLSALDGYVRFRGA